MAVVEKALFFIRTHSIINAKPQNPPLVAAFHNFSVKVMDRITLQNYMISTQA